MFWNILKFLYPQENRYSLTMTWISHIIKHRTFWRGILIHTFRKFISRFSNWGYFAGNVNVCIGVLLWIYFLKPLEHGSINRHDRIAVTFTLISSSWPSTNICSKKPFVYLKFKIILQLCFNQDWGQFKIATHYTEKKTLLLQQNILLL